MYGVDTSQYGVQQVHTRNVPDWTRHENSLFRGDTRSPEEIRADGGFRPPYFSGPDGMHRDPSGMVADIPKHVGGGTNAFVSTSTGADVSTTFAGKNGAVYVVNAPGGIYTDPTLRQETGKETHGEDEVLFPGGIDWRYVRGWHPMRYEPGSGLVMGEFVPNPDYIGDRASTTPTSTATDQPAPARTDPQQPYHRSQEPAQGTQPGSQPDQSGSLPSQQNQPGRLQDQRGQETQPSRPQDQRGQETWPSRLQDQRGQETQPSQPPGQEGQSDQRSQDSRPGQEDQPGQDSRQSDQPGQEGQPSPQQDQRAQEDQPGQPDQRSQESRPDQYGPTTPDASRPAEESRQDTSPITERLSGERPASLGDRMGQLDDPRLDALRPHLHSTEGGMSAFAPPTSDDPRQQEHHQNEQATANQVPRIPGQFVVDMHGSSDSVRIGDTQLSPRDLADIIRANPDYDGGPVSLLGCNTGSDPNGFAARLAQELGVPVTAPTRDAWVDHDGNVFASSQAHNTDPSKPSRPTWPPNGEWNTYSPTGEQTSNRSPYPPGHTPAWATDSQSRPTGTATNRGDDSSPPSDEDSPEDNQPSQDDRNPTDDEPRDLAERTGDPEANERRDAAVADVAQRLGITDPDQIRALAHAYEVAREYTAPVIVDVAARIHDDVAAAVERNPERRVAFLGRDGHSLALATRTMEPDFFNQHCSEVVLSRAVVESAMRDLERGGTEFQGIDEFRMPKKVDESLVPGAAQRLEMYLASEGVPVNRPGAEISLVDTSYKGTVQELLAAAYPDVDFQGHYAFHGQEPTDPHPDNKKGYLVDLGPETGGGRPLGELTDDPALTWAHQDAIGSIEETLNGTMSSPRGIGPEGPVQQPQRYEEDQTSGINPTKIDPAFTDPLVREGAKAMAMSAVADAAQHAVARREAGADWRGELSASAERTRDQIRAWVGDDIQATDPRFREVMDSMVRRDDKKIVIQLTDTIEQLGMNETDARAVWDAYSRCETKEERKQFAAELAARGGQQ